MVRKICEMWREMKAITAMVVVQIATAVLNILFKLAVVDGMEPRVLVAYRLFFATLFMLPLSFVFQREKRPEFTWNLLLLALLSGLLGAVLPSIFSITGLSLTSATFASAAAVLTPLITFVLAAFLRQSVRFGTREGKAKVFGTLLGVGGAFVFILYRGKDIHIWSTHIDLMNKSHDSSRDATSHHISLLGALFVFGGNFSYAFWLLLQAISKQFGGAYWNATLMNLTGSVVAVIIALCWNCDLKEWKLGWNIRLFTIAYASIVMSGMVIAVNAWCVESRGPLFVSVFSPIALVVVALVGSFILNETLHVGSIVGTVIIVGGLYLVLWGKNKEMKSITPTSDYIETNKTNKDISLNNVPTLNTNVP
ncbi:unnamed protein product [Eruca vesicaria subsp. sativa]|uniref:WAT1-related protein n=1 Tax=Eruca vesicaria subsp. sativa TaxID=29727 RepID=A0ABC8KPD7_ERUVS|nr:unnamed protein product [Eruca vesicaria subsp. sativa]